MFWRKKEPQNDQAALVEVIDAITSEKITPEEGAKRLGHFFTLSLDQLNDIAVQMSNQGLTTGALRLAETNMILAEKQKDEKSRVHCACTLAQLLSGNPDRLEERLELLEYAVPELLEWDVSDQIKGTLLTHLADARFNACNHQPALYASVAEAVEQAFTYKDDIHEFLLGRLCFIAGTALDEIGEDEKILRQSVRYLETGLQYYTLKKYPEEYASTLNNLGNSYKHLGMLKNDREILEKAIQVYDQALPHRTAPQLRSRTQNNRKEAVEVLERLKNNQPLPQKSRESTEDQRIRSLVRAGDDSFYASIQKDSGSERNRQAAVEKYLEASRLVGREASPAVRAEVYHRFATLFLRATEDDPLWTAYCFANATKRLAQGQWREVSQARVLMHQGEALAQIGLPDDEGYLAHAAELLRTALPMMQAQGQPGEADQCSQYLGMCLSILSAKGGAAQTRQAQEFFAQGESARLENLDPSLTSNVEVREQYRRYAAFIKKIAPHELKMALGALRAERDASLAKQHFDEFNHAKMLIEVAGEYLDLGELAGALETMQIAEELATAATYSAPSILCDVARFYASIPMLDSARRCLDIAQTKMDFAAPDDVAVLPGDTTGRWIPESSLESYQEEIDTTRQEIAKGRTVRFDAARAARLLCPEDAARRKTIQDAIEENSQQFE